MRWLRRSLWAGLRAAGRAAGRLGLRHRDYCALGRHLHPSACRALERHTARDSAASRAGLCRAGFPYAFHLSVSSGCRIAASRETSPASGLLGVGCGHLLHRVLARPRRPRLALRVRSTGRRLAAIVLVLAGALASTASTSHASLRAVASPMKPPRLPHG